MLRNYFLIAWRNLKRHKIFSLINILGLATGMAACLLILQYVSFELSYDDFHTKGDRIYRVSQLAETGNGKEQDACGYNAAGPAMQRDFPEVVDYAHVRLRENCVFSYENIHFRESKVGVASEHFLTLFTFPLLQGDPASALLKPNTVVLSQPTAQKYFGTADPMGKTIRFDDGSHHALLTVTGVMQPMPANSHLHLDALISYPTSRGWPVWEFDWKGNNDYVYVLLDEKAEPAKVAARLPAFLQKYTNQPNATLEMQALRDIHLYSNKTYEAEPNGSAQSVYLLLTVGMLILIIAWVNYINLATARSVDRAKEVGLRKVVGSSRRQLIGQFMLESVLINLLAVVIAFTWVQLSQPLLDDLTGKPLSTHSIHPLYWWAWITTFGLGALVAGFYPALVLSGFQPITALRGHLSGSRRGIVLRRSLVIAQFAATVVVLVGTVTVYRQLRFMRQQHLGMNIDQTLVIYAPRSSALDSSRSEKFDRFKQNALTLATVQSVSASECLPGNGMYELNSNSGDIRRSGDSDPSRKRYFLFGVDADFVRTLGMKSLAGEGFSTEHRQENRGKVVINEAAMHLLGYRHPQEAVHQFITWFGSKREIAQIISNYHHHSLERSFDPMIYYWDMRYENAGYLTVKLNPGVTRAENLSKTIAHLQTSWRQSFPDNPFDYYFLDERFNSQYKADEQFGRVFGLFAVLAIFVACLGLFGLALFTTTQRTKEIGVRKVLGASVSSILLLLSRDFMKLVLLANLLAWPLAYGFVSRWLAGYAFRIEISPWLFALPTLLVLLVALLTVTFQTLRAARQNPVKALRTE